MPENLPEKIKYPIGKMNIPEKITPDIRKKWIDEISAFADELKEVLYNTDTALFEKSYREGGWTIRQIVHHIFDSHVNAYIRFKLALTSEKPTIVPYDENRWAALEDTFSIPPEVSVGLIDGLHRRWVALMKSLPEEDYKKVYFHPEHNKFIPLDEMIGTYAWHGKHHLGHIKSVK